jgi:hypothetical protein
MSRQILTGKVKISEFNIKVKVFFFKFEIKWMTRSLEEVPPCA